MIFSPALSAGASQSSGSSIHGSVTRAQNGAPLAGVAIGVSGSSTAAAVTDAQGAYTISGLNNGAIAVTASLAGYDTVLANAQVALNTSIVFSPKLYAGASTPDGANKAAVQGVILDAASNAPLAGAQVRASVAGQADRGVTTAADGRFAFTGIAADSVTLATSLQGYGASMLQIPLQPLQTLDVGQIRLRKTQTTQLLPDLKVAAASRMRTNTDPQSLRLSGSVVASIANIGTAAATGDIEVLAFYDANGNGVYDAGVDADLGRTVIVGGIAVGASQNVSIAVTGTMPFRDVPIHVWVDSRNAVIESNKTNNVRSTAFATELVPNIAAFDPVLKWEWTGSDVMPTFYNVMSAPVTAPLYDSNGDGKIDQNDTPSIAFIAYEGPTGAESSGVLRIIGGKDGKDILTVTDPKYRLRGYSNLAVADIDGSGHPAIIALRERAAGAGLIAFNADGSVRWTTPPTALDVNSTYGWGGVSIADLDGDGKAEIIYGNQVYNHDGTLRWTGAGGFLGPQGTSTAVSLVADINMNGRPAVISGASAFDSDGTLLWKNDVAGNGLAAVARFNGDAYPQIALVARGSVYLLDHAGALIWGPVPIPGGGNGGPPTIADMDGDGIPEIGVAGANDYTVFRADGSVLWSAATQDASSSSTGSTVFDFAGNGQANVLYGDETMMRVYNGKDGKVIFSEPNSSGTALEFPVVVDVDNDGHADFMVVGNTYIGNSRGIRVFQDRNNAWVNTRAIWNQHAYHVTNINDDGSVPKVEENSWEKNNTYRANRSTRLYSCAAPLVLLDETFATQTGGWTPLNGRGGNVGAIVNGAYARTGAGASSIGSTAWGDYTAELKLRLPDGGASDAGLALRVKGPDLWYGLSVQSNMLKLVQYKQGSLTTVQQTPLQLAGDPALVHTLRAEVVGGTLKGYLDNQLLLNASGLEWTQGAVGTQQGATTAVYSGLKVSSYAPPVAQDVSASYVRIKDDGAGAYTFTSRIGNSGSLNLPLGIPVSFSGIDAVGGQQKLLGIANTKAVLAPGQFEDVQFAYHSAAGAFTQLIVNANSDAAGVPAFQECDAANNTVSLPLSAVPGVFSLSVTTDQPAYAAGSYVRITAPLVNRGSVDGAVQLRFVIQNASGAPVVELPGQTVAVPQGGQQSALMLWNTGAVLAGAYVVKAQLVDANGVAYAEASSPFSISAAGTTVGATLSTERQLYQAADTVKLTARLSNLAHNSLLSNARIVTTVKNPDGTQRFSATENLAQLAADGQKDYVYSIALGGGSAAGRYGASMVVTAADGTPLAQAATQFAVASPADSGLGLSGTLVLDKQVALGESLVLDVAAKNAGNVPFTNLLLKVGIVDVATQKIVAEFPYTQTLNVGASFNAASNWISAGAPGNHYVAVLTAVVGGQSLTLAQASFTVVARPIKFDIKQTIPAGSRVLVLLSCQSVEQGDDDDDDRRHGSRFRGDDGDDGRQRPRYCGDDGDEHDGHQVNQCLVQRAQAVKAALDALGVSYQIVQTVDGFRRALRGGYYNVYWISNAQYALGNTLARELREAIHNGDSLITDAGIAARNQILDDISGVQVGEVSGRQLPLTLNGSDFPNPATLPTEGRIQALQALAGAKVQASFSVESASSGGECGEHDHHGEHCEHACHGHEQYGHGYGQEKHGCDAHGQHCDDAQGGTQTRSVPGIVSNQYGTGHTLAFGFDLVATLLTHSAAWQDSVHAAFSAVTPAAPVVPAPGAYLPLKSSVTNQANAMDLDFKTTLPVGVAYVASNPVGSYDSRGRAIDWSFNLANDRTKDLLLMVQLQNAGRFNLQSQLSTLNKGIATRYGDPLAQSLSVTAAAQTGADVIKALQALPLRQRQEQKLRDAMVNELKETLYYFARNRANDYETAICQLIDMSGALSGLTSVDVTEIHAGFDRILKETQWRWTLLQPAPVNSGPGQH